MRRKPAALDDVIYDEDRSRIRADGGPGVMARVRDTTPADPANSCKRSRNANE
jgi:hypothetical protein